MSNGEAVLAMIERVRGGADARDVIGGLSEGKKGVEGDVEDDLRERVKSFLGERKRK